MSVKAASSPLSMNLSYRVRQKATVGLAAPRPDFGEEMGLGKKLETRNSASRVYSVKSDYSSRKIAVLRKGF